MSHTPGPWGYVYDGSSDWSIGPADDPQATPVAHCWVPHYRDTSTMVAGVPVADLPADVRLIAAAPTMLEALKLIESVYRLNCVAVGEPSSVLAAVQAAIAKAEGQ